MSVTRQQINSSGELIANQEDTQLQLMLKAVKKNEIEKLEHLLGKANVDLNKILAEDRTLLQTAIKRGHSKIVIKLLDKKADPNCANKRKFVPLHYASGSSEITEILIEAKSNPNILDSEGLTPLHHATLENEPAVVKQLLKSLACPNLTLGAAPIHLAVFKEYTEIVNALLDAKADVNIQNKHLESNLTPLSYAVRTGNIDLVKTLLEHKANPNQYGSGGYCSVPLNQIKHINPEPIQKLLLEYGAVPALKKNQDLIIEPIIQLGYGGSSSKEEIKGGVCYGVTTVGIPYILSDNVEYLNTTFATLNKYRMQTSSLIDNIAEENRKQARSLLCPTYESNDEIYQPKIYKQTLPRLKEEDVLLEMPAFCQNTHLAQSVWHYHKIFSDSIQDLIYRGQSYPFIYIPLIKSLKCENINIVKHIEFTGVYNISDLETLFRTLRTILRSESVTEPIAIRQWSTTHIIAFGYHPSKDAWSYLDGNQIPITYTKEDKIIAHRIMAGLSKKGVGIFNTEIFSGNNEKLINRCITSWCELDSWKKIHAVTSKKSKLRDSDKAFWHDQTSLSGIPNLTQDLLRSSFFYRHRHMITNMTMIGAGIGYAKNETTYSTLFLGALLGLVYGFRLAKKNDENILSKAAYKEFLNKKAMSLFPEEAKQPTYTITKPYSSKASNSQYLFFRNRTFDDNTPKPTVISEIMSSPS